MTEAIQKQLADAAAAHAAAHRVLETRREELYAAIRKAANGGMSTRAIADKVALSHQRIAQIVSGY